ncbi:unnamed protein product, partial [Urochloa humidicola]
SRSFPPRRRHSPPRVLTTPPPLSLHVGHHHLLALQGKTRQIHVVALPHPHAAVPWPASPPSLSLFSLPLPHLHHSTPRGMRFGGDEEAISRRATVLTEGRRSRELELIHGVDEE